MNQAHTYCSDALVSPGATPKPTTPKSPPPYYSSRLIYNNDGFQEAPEETFSAQSFSSSSDSNPSGDSPFDTKKNSMTFETSSYSAPLAPTPGHQMVQFSLALGPAAPSLFSNPTVFTFGPIPAPTQTSPPYTPLENTSSSSHVCLRHSQQMQLHHQHQQHQTQLSKEHVTSEPAILTEPAPANRRRLASSRGGDDPAERRDSPQQRALADLEMDMAPPESICIEAQSTARKVKDALLRLCESGAHFFSREDRANFQFLADTVTLLVQYLDAQSPSIRAIHTHRHLTRALLRALEETLEKLQRLLRHESALTDSFEIFELTLRRYLEQFKRMFPLGQAPVSPLQLIEDPAARAVWERCCGATKSFVRFEQFERDVIEPEFGRGDRSESGTAASSSTASSRQQVLVFLRYLVNFPADDIVTAYKWNLLTRLFGPYDQFVENFSRICLGKGFLGLINRIKASEILSVHGKDTVLIRFSRTEPEYLAFSYHDANGVGHLINCDKQRKIIPLDTFMRQKFPGFRLVDQYLNVRAIVKTSLSGYSETPSSGYLQSHA